jgi:hypothetical protein
VSVNKFQPYLYVLPEDDANRYLANGFVLNVTKLRQIYVLKVAGGWNEVLRLFSSVHVREMEHDVNRFMLLLIDFDDRADRLDRARQAIPSHLANRVFVLGAKTNPEALRAGFGLSYEKIGEALARDCRDDTNTTWGHELLRHNGDEIARMRTLVRPILF